MSLISKILNVKYPTIPFSDNALFWLNGRIFKSGSNYYFYDKSGNGRHFLITNYDFETNWNYGFPYKSIATISAPAGDATLIAEDVNNFLYDGGGTPIAIPVVSLFQNVDYADKLFCRHINQVVNSNNKEVKQARIVDIVLYDTTKTGSDLTDCNTYYSVPTKDTATWVSSTGNDANDGSEANPLATITHALTHTPTQIYVKTGTYDAGATYYTVSKNIKCIGNVRHTNVPASYLFLINTTITLFGFNITRASTGTYPIYIAGSVTPVIERCSIKNHVRVCIAATGTGGATFKHCAIKLEASTTNTFTIQKKSVIIDSCYISDNTSSVSIACTYASGAIEAEIKNNKIIKNYSSVGTFFDITYNSTFIKITGNNFSNIGIIAFNNTNITLFNFNDNTGYIAYISANGTGTGTCNILRNNISSSDTHAKLYFVNKSVEIQENIINNTGSAGFIVIDSTINFITVNILRNRFHATGGSHGIGIGLDEIGTYANYIHGTYKYNILIQDGTPINEHGVQVLNNNFTIQYNKSIGSALAYIFKGSNIDLDSSLMSHNVAYDGMILLKGVNLAKVYNNTVKLITETPSLHIMSNDPYLEMDNNDVKNNIFINDLSSGTFALIYIEDSGHTNTLNYNLLYTSGLEIGQIDTTKYTTFANWQSQGYEANGINQNPNLDSNLIPSIPITPGFDLGASYDEGLDISTNWGETNRLPRVVTKQQSGTWQIGAYVQ